MTILDVVLIILALNIGMVLGAWWHSIFDMQRCYKCMEQQQSNKQKN